MRCFCGGENDMKKGMTKFEVLTCIVVVLAIAVGGASLLMLDVTGKGGNRLRSDFVYDISDQVAVDEALILYDEVAEVIEVGLENAKGIALDKEGNVYVSGGAKVAVFDVDGKRIDEFEFFSDVRCLAVGNDGTVFAGVKDHVEVRRADGSEVSSWKSLGERAVVTSIAIGEDYVFVADAGNRVVVQYDKQGEVLSLIGKRDADRNIGGFVIPSPYFDLAIADDGLLRVVNPGGHRIEAYTFDGDLEFWWGEAGSDIDEFCGCCNPVNFAIAVDGSFITCEKGLDRVKVYDEDGEFVGVVAGPEQLVGKGNAAVCVTPEQCQSGGFDVAVDESGKVYVLDTQKNVVRMFVAKETKGGVQ